MGSINLNIIKDTWNNKVYSNFKKTLTRTPVTKTVSNISDNETLTDGTPNTNFKGIFFKKEDTFSQEYMGLFKGADAILLIKTTQTLNKNDKISFDGKTYRVEEIEPRYAGNLKIHQTARLFLVT